MGTTKVKKNHKLTLRLILHELTRIGMVEEDVAKMLLEKKGKSQEYPLAVIAKFGIKDRRPPNLPLSLESLVHWLAAYANLPYFVIDPLKIDIAAVTSLLPVAFITRLGSIPVRVEQNRVVFASAEPFDTTWINEVKNVVEKEVHVVVSSPFAIKHFIDEFFLVRKESHEFKATKPKENISRTLEIDQMHGGGKRNVLDRNESSVTRIVDWLFQYAADERATDIHLEPRMGSGQVRFRIDGHMRIVYKFEPEIMLPVISRIKILANMKVDEKRRPQDGQIRRQFGMSNVMEMRLSTIPTHYGEKLVVRIFDPSMSGTDFKALGFADDDIQLWTALINLPHGLVLVTGPTGSGKSTTLHTSMRQIAQENVNICTVEDPIEIVNDDLNQMQVNKKLDITFGSAIRSILRQDPDIIMVGEIRDTDAGEMAMQAALTGHLVLSTLHTNDAISSIIRLIDLGIPPHLITASLRGMMAQRLVRRLCEHCKSKILTPKETWKELCGDHQIPMPKYVYTPEGCGTCKQSGYIGRICVYEMVLMDRTLMEVVRKTVSIEELQKATDGKYTPMKVSAAGKVRQGVTDIAEVIRVVF